MNRIDFAETNPTAANPTKRQKFDLDGVSSPAASVNMDSSWWQSVKSAAPFDDKLPGVDVVIPVHNSSETIEAAMSSAWHQNYSGSITLLVFDDCSSDSTAEKLSNFRRTHADTDARKLVLIHHSGHSSGGSPGKTPSSGGAGYARNRCVEGGSADVLVFLDSDDIMMESRVQEQVKTLYSLPDGERERAIVGCRFYREPQNSTYHYTLWANTLSAERLYLERYRELTLLQPTWCMLRQRFSALGGYMEAGECLDSSGEYGDGGSAAGAGAVAGQVSLSSEVNIIFRFSSRPSPFSILHSPFFFFFFRFFFFCPPLT